MAKRGASVGPEVTATINVVSDTSQATSGLKDLEGKLQQHTAAMSQQVDKLEKKLQEGINKIGKLSEASNKLAQSRRNWSSGVETAQARGEAAVKREGARAAAEAQIQQERRVTEQFKAELRERERAVKQTQRNLAQTSPSQNLQGQINSSIKGSNQWYMQSMLTSGALVPTQSRSAGLQQAINQAIFATNAGGSPPRPPAPMMTSAQLNAQIKQA